MVAIIDTTTTYTVENNLTKKRQKNRFSGSRDISHTKTTG